MEGRFKKFKTETLISAAKRSVDSFDINTEAFDELLKEIEGRLPNDDFVALMSFLEKVLED